MKTKPLGSDQIPFRTTLCHEQANEGSGSAIFALLIEPCHEKTNNVSEQVRHTLSCTSTENG